MKKSILKSILSPVAYCICTGTDIYSYAPDEYCDTERKRKSKKIRMIGKRKIK